jgi:hypothetical protein
MSDSFITLVPNPVKPDEVGNLSKKAVDWLINNKIIVPGLSDCTLGQSQGYAPGPRYREIIEGDDVGLTRIVINGLEVITERQVFDNGENGIEEINCPKCGANNIEAEWGEIVGRWDNGEDDRMKCVECAKETPITNYEFVPAFGFGEFGLTFWNWPALKEEFVLDLKNLLEKDIKVIYGRV